MASKSFVEAYSLNIAANPHPPGVYVRALTRASSILVRIRGSDSAKITAPKPDKLNDGYYVGRILLWTEIDWKGNWLDLDAEDALPPEEKAKVIVPTKAKPNYRVFSYAFDVEKHTLYFESRNEFGRTFGPDNGRRLFTKLLSPEVLGDHSPEISVTLIPQETAIEQILSLPRLRKLTIRISRPNADLTSTPSRKRIFRELEAAKAKQIEIIYTKEAGAESLERTPEIEERTDAASIDGFVKGESRGNMSGKNELSTNDLPKKLTLSLDSGSNFVARIRAALLPRQERRSRR